ncbi:MAG: ECF transporter S component [Candidatus Dormibacteraeota bacterium]|nr:ECF transporter S component [Candidatus Dormibacteraeota bacterium]
MTRSLPLGAVSLLGLALFVWPFLGSGLPSYTPAWTLALAAAAGLLVVEAGVRQLDARGVALLAALAAIDTGLRLVVSQGVGGFSPVFFLVLCSGYALGPTYGFLVGAFSILVSSLAVGGVGPWVPYQVFATGWVGVAAGLAGRWRRDRVRAGWRDVIVLAVVGAAAGWAFGALMDIQDWITFYRGSPGFGWQPGMAASTSWLHFARFYLVTSLAYDSFRAAGNVLMVGLLGLPVLVALSRLRARLAFEIVPEGG